MFIRSVTWKSGVMNRRICRPLKIQEMVLGSPPLMLQLPKSTSGASDGIYVVFNEATQN